LEEECPHFGCSLLPIAEFDGSPGPSWPLQLISTIDPLIPNSQRIWYKNDRMKQIVSLPSVKR